MAASALLVAGVFTPVASLVAALTLAATGSPLVQDFTWTITLEAVLICLMLQGPGAYSLDARMFGRREIIIPPPEHREYHD